MLKRSFDLIFAVLLIMVLALPILVIAMIVKLTSRGPAIHWSERVGRLNINFKMPKFRSMVFNSPQVATHLLQNPDQLITPVGRFLRKTSLDELPQVWSVLIGDMSFVGPRPALFNQDDLVAARTAAGVHLLRPGITGWAQVNGRDELSIPEKVRFDEEYLKRSNLFFDLKIMLQTVVRVSKAEGVRH